MRIDKYICDTINITRAQAKRRIAQGRVTLDGKGVCSGSVQTCADSVVTLDGVRLIYRKYVYIMLNKPRGVVSAATDKHSKTALDLLCDSDRRADLFIAGRLDKDTSGFLLITNDGTFAHELLSPVKHVYKTYEVTLAHGDFSGYERRFEEGITLDNGYTCKPARFYSDGSNRCTVEIREGKFHQIKRMFQALGNEVVALKRTAIAGVYLDSTLSEGQYRELTDVEYEQILNNLHKKDAQ